MGFFDKLFGKDKKEVSVPEREEHKEAAEVEERKTVECESVSSDEQVASEPAEEKTAVSDTDTPVINSAEGIKDNVSGQKNEGEKISAIFEMFPVKKDSVPAGRINEICAKFINDALAMGQELKAGDLQMLSYEELCVLYNNMQMMDMKLDPKIKAIAGVVIKNNLKVIRTKLIAEMKKRTLYTIYTRMNMLPFSNNASFYLFTDKELAESQIKASGIKYLLLKEIPAEYVEMHFDVFYLTGFKEAIVDSGVKVSFTDLYQPKSTEVYGIVNPELCSKMIFFNQMTESINEKARTSESKQIPAEDLRRINAVWADITEGLIRTSLLIPAEKTEDGRAKYKGVAVVDPAGKKWIALFTDQAAINTFFKASQIAAVVKNPILSQYEAIKDKEEYEGIIINPAREGFRIPSRVLATRKTVKPDEDASNKQE